VLAGIRQLLHILAADRKDMQLARVAAHQRIERRLLVLYRLDDIPIALRERPLEKRPEEAEYFRGPAAPESAVADRRSTVLRALGC
jgi:hypothetical protein